MPGDPRYRVLYAIWAFLECLGFGGLIYGWVSLVYVLKDEGLYLELCDGVQNVSVIAQSIAASVTANISNVVSYADPGNSSIAINALGTTAATISSSSQSCSAREDKLNLAFTVGGAMFCLGCFVMGQINFKFGTRITRIGALFLFIAGAFMIAFTSNNVPWLIFPGLSLIGSGGITYLMTNTQVSMLFPQQGSMVVGMLCGGFDASSSIQMFVKIGYENGISRKTSYIIIAVSHLLTLISTFFFLPKDFISKPPVSPSHADVAVDGEAAVELTGEKKKQDEETKLASQPTLRSCLTSPTYIIHVLWLSMLQLRFYFMLGSFNVMLESLVDGDKKQVSHFTDVLSYMMIGGLVASPFAGFVYDFHNRFFNKTSNVVYRNLMPAVIPLAITSTLCLIMSALIMVEHQDALYPIFIFLVLFRSFMYTMAAGFVSAIFPSEYFGLLYGIMIFIGGMLSYFQNLLFQWSESAGFKPVNIFLIVMTLVTYGHPLFQWWKARKALRSASLSSENDNRPMVV